MFGWFRRKDGGTPDQMTSTQISEALSSIAHDRKQLDQEREVLAKLQERMNQRDQHASQLREQVDHSMFSARSGRQFARFAAGAGFTILAAVVTRRALVKRHVRNAPPYFQKNDASVKLHAYTDALAAFNIATLNVFSYAIMVTGGLLWSFDISNIQELRGITRAAIGFDTDSPH